MSVPSTSLWPSQFGELDVQTPVTILRQQAGALGQMTQNIVYGTVLTAAHNSGFRHRFSLFCPPLGYSVELLIVDHGIDMYPAKITVAGDSGPPPDAAKDAEDFKQKLRQVFESERIKKIIRGLLAQSKQE